MCKVEKSLLHLSANIVVQMGKIQTKTLGEGVWHEFKHMSLKQGKFCSPKYWVKPFWYYPRELYGPIGIEFYYFLDISDTG